MKFLVDMDLPPSLAVFLRGKGFDAIHLREENLQTLPDSGVLHKAMSEGRVVLTHDLDFADLMAASGDSLPSVVILRLHDMRPHHVEETVKHLLQEHGEDIANGVIASVRDTRVRIRDLPIG